MAVVGAVAAVVVAAAFVALVFPSFSVLPSSSFARQVLKHLRTVRRPLPMVRKVNNKCYLVCLYKIHDPVNFVIHFQLIT